MKAIKVKVKAPFFDENGIHKRGEICTVSNFRPEFMELLMDEESAEVVGICGIDTHSAVFHTRRTTLPATHTELGGKESCSHRFG